MKLGIVAIGRVSSVSKSFSGKGAFIQSVDFTFRTNQGKLIHSSFISPYGLYNPVDKVANKVTVVYLDSNPKINQDQHSMPESMSDFIFRIVVAPLVLVILVFLLLAFDLHNKLQSRFKPKLEKAPRWRTGIACALK